MTTPENENGYPPEAEHESTASVHPFTEDEPAATGLLEDDQAEDLASAEVMAPAQDLAPEDGPVDVTELGPLFGESRAGDFRQRWQEIQVGFVEDPANAVKRAEDLTGSILTSLTEALEERRGILDKSAQDGDTEQLRLVIRQYREVLEGIISL